MKRSALVVLVLLTYAVSGGVVVIAQQPEGLSAGRRAEHLAAFDRIWTIVRDRHWDPALNGVDWEGAKREMRPRVEAATSDNDARAAMNALVDRLGQTHFNVLPGELFAPLGDGSTSSSRHAVEARRPGNSS